MTFARIFSFLFRIRLNIDVFRAISYFTETDLKEKLAKKMEYAANYI